jgi:hypothetical protein
MRGLRMLAVWLAMTAGLRAGPGTMKSFRDLGSAPAYAVCAVEEVTRGRAASPYEHFYELRARVLRGFGAKAGERIAVRYRSADSPLPMQASGGGSSEAPVVRRFVPGQAALFALERGTAAVELGDWLPALRDAPGGMSHSAREFFLRELVQTLTRGPIRDRLQAAALLSQYDGEVPAELARLLRASLGSNDDAWLETGCVFLGLWGVPLETQAELTYGEASPPFHGLRQMVTWILWKGDRRDYPNRLIRCLLRNAGEYSWGAANALLQYKDSTVFLDGVNAAMRRNAAGTMTVAWFAAKAGKQAVLPDGLDFAVRLVERKSASPLREIHPAVQMILTYGDAAHFDALVRAVARFQKEDESFYRELWGAAGYGVNRRELALARVLIGDKRPGFVTLRYCDVAASVVQRLSGQDFGVTQQMPQAARDAAVGRAAAWLAAHQTLP